MAQSLLSSGIGPVLSQALTLALVPVLFRLYTPEDFGAWAVIQVIAIGAGSLASLRFDLALVMERDPRAAEQLLFAVVAVVISCSVAAGFAIVFSAGYLETLGIDGLSAAMGWCWLLLVGLGVVFQGWLMREGAFAKISIGVVLNAIVTNLVQLGGGLFGHGSWLVTGSVAGQAAALMFNVWIVMRSTHRPDPKLLKFDKMLSMLQRNRRFPKISLPFTILSLLRERAPIFIIGLFAPSAAVGLYSQAWRLTHFPSGLTSAALRPVFFHRTASEGLEAQGAAIDRLVRSFLLASGPAIGFVAFGNDALAETLLGPRWRGAGQLAAMLVFPAALFTITNWMDRLLDAVGRQDVNLKVEVIAGLSSIGALWGALGAGSSLMTAVFLQCVALSASYLWFLWTCYRVAGWPRVGLVFSLLGAIAIIISTYLFLVVLSLILTQFQVLLTGATLVALAGIAVFLIARRGA
ncbi:oligosaccharide flippase family protein [Bradyrhizobium sp. 23]|uniref:oligosaccharide flippase family protein n=1 Tax=Bradyrhizobium sp. 23 TaxID=2782667 RepID=UPI001FFB3299|nr:oligosaccharide flippase family protein [Bradyrhizobium sp. 23]MCK1313376.1 oligosaccharide flippase family protein [Bradyrhizobium sp. 23]